ncbi:hypothetical protein FPV67DRAFT_1672130 [Lyophyllum atratum]|nr:hypothetical protein FPV67DRAFT_1672130 [Lyophyllum atratum]
MDLSGLAPQSLAAVPSSKSSDGPNFILGPEGDMSIVHPTSTRSIVHHTSTAFKTAPLAVPTRHVASQHAQSLLVPTGTVMSLSSQPLRTSSLPLPISSGLYSLSSSLTHTSAVLALTSASILSSAPITSVVSTASSTLPTSSDDSLLLSTTVTSAPVSVSTAVPTETAFSLSTSSGAEATSDIPTTTLSSQSASPSPSVPTSSEDNASVDQGHHAPFYIGIILGTIVTIGFIAAIIAWVVRLRMHARRRRGTSIVPWANHQSDDGLEEGHEATYIGQPIDRIGSKDISSQDAIPWEPRGDRDVGEPKRSNSYVRRSAYSGQAADPFVDHHPYPVLAESVAYPLPLYHTDSTRRDSYPDAEGSLDGHRSVSTLGPLQVANVTPGDNSAASSRASTALGLNSPLPGSSEHEYHDGRPRENQAGSRPPFLALEDEGLRVPWKSTRQVSSAKRRMGGSGNWERLPVPGESQDPSDVAADDDSWTSSLKSNLTHAFNAVAASLPAGPALMRGTHREDANDILTPRPHQHSGRRSTRSNFSGVDFKEPLSRNDSVASTPWTLEENDDGTGRVHFHGRERDAYEYGTPQVYGSCLTLDAPTSVGTSLHRTSTRGSHTPLITRPPQSALLRPEMHNKRSRYGSRRQRQPSMRSTVSRASSVYSMESAVSGATSTIQSSAPRIPAFSRHSTMKIDALQPVREKREEGAVEERPGTLVTRSSSSGCSFNSYYYGAGGGSVNDRDMSEVEEPARQSLVDRRKIRRVV